MSVAVGISPFLHLLFQILSVQETRFLSKPCWYRLIPSETSLFISLTVSIGNRPCSLEGHFREARHPLVPARRLKRRKRSIAIPALLSLA
jgi:hypothetical protein